MNREQGLQWIEKTRIIAIVRGVEERHINDLSQALLDGGIRAMEITLNTSGALSMITKLQAQFGDHMYIGAGTVLDMEDAKQAIEAGASYIVTPNTDEDVIRYAVEQGVPIFPGAMTPTEIVKAWKAGATAVKIFPGASLGLAYIKELQGPLNHIPMVAVGGVNEANIGQFIQAGCYGLGIGGSLINLQEIAAGNFSWIRDKAAALTANVWVK
ncbi:MULTISPECIES: bifunctional 4-hydroxy-2-oxoglutarate aldolase/2-dehydro-3-deoxy-phosphogluconate aldolase [Paenibacillus]|uniref:Bifunctional 4-hydroxy-2-oxoglutarate aldolase/2-dehydro-3-deoxy-phosphogluconate aldolase n=1 Tax=Paenibacillus baimaensis TaxID=2982185 RepID=A0ABT2UJ56_9BACL|nr:MULTISPECIES: bifunctional 4-hydroxy-2-oxoglutarate aldolase/2-dehydro-3-deoxy-phosphogluconate aldolase [unclassified Paenibacillus]MCU6794653.1 bifunctional 4-hydroxy-2-oxoglutarate aldolase/2-dehydro-3-deoxy-phosphogluconate aldolase [Paenibacillus sp. WQ 127069]OMF19489.1 2-dehydro-3-deoxyphosphogluconate aldolase [Paenibacillus sp. FSL H7-0331]